MGRPVHDQNFLSKRSEMVRENIRRCCVPEPGERPTIKEI
jgi:hypothetical protein